MALVPFVTKDYQNRYQIHPEAKCKLSQLDANKPIAVLSVVGKKNTGKSFLINQIAGNHLQSSQSSEISLSILCNSQQQIVILDTQGFVEQQDNRILILPLILSSYLIYNSIGEIKQQQIKTLNGLVNVARDVQLKYSSADPCPYFPKVNWVLRDVDAVTDKLGQNLSQNQYLDYSLAELKGVSESIEQKNKIRRNFKGLFSDRQCTILEYPFNQELVLKPSFVEQVQKLKRRMLKSIPVKYFGGSAVNSRMFMLMAENLVKSLNCNQIPRMSRFWDEVYVAKQKQILCQIKSELYLHLVNHLEANIKQTAQKLIEKFNAEFHTTFGRRAINCNSKSQPIQTQIQNILKEMSEAFTVWELSPEQLKYIDIMLEKYQLIDQQLQSQSSSLTFNNLQDILTKIANQNSSYYRPLTVYKVQALQSQIKSKMYDKLCRHHESYLPLGPCFNKGEDENAMLRSENNNLKQKVEHLFQEKLAIEQRIEQTETRIVEQIGRQELRIRSLIEDSQKRQKQKDLIIERLENILKESNIVQKEELATKNYLLQNQVSKLKQENYQYKQQLKVVNEKLQLQCAKHEQEILTLKHKSSKRPSNEDWELQRIYFETQLSMQTNLNNQNQRLIKALLERQKIFKKQNEHYLKENQSLKNKLKKLIFSPKQQPNIIIRVPAFTSKEIEPNKYLTEFEIEVAEGNQKRLIKKRYKQINELCQTLKGLVPDIRQPKFNHNLKNNQQRRKQVEKYLNQCLRMPEYIQTEILRRFLKADIKPSSPKYVKNTSIESLNDVENKFEQSYNTKLKSEKIIKPKKQNQRSTRVLVPKKPKNQMQI